MKTPIPCFLLSGRRVAKTPKDIGYSRGSPDSNVDLRQIAGQCVHEVLVVTGYDAEAIGHVLEDLPIRFVFNPDWREGMGGSIAFGVSKLDATLDGAAIVPADMPFLSPSVIERLASRFHDLGGESVVFPTTRSGAQRNPVIWPRRFFGLLVGLTGPEGGKRLLTELADLRGAVSIGDEKALRDIDSPDDMADARESDHTNS